VEFLWTRPRENPKSKTAKAKPAKPKVEDIRRAEATSIARRLRELLDSGEPLVWDAEAAAAGTPRARPLARGDIAILFRALGDVHLYESALRAEGLDYYLVGGHAFYAQQEVHDFVHLLRAVASQADELALAGALRSPIFALHDETLFWLARAGKSLGRGLDIVGQIEELPADERTKAVRAAAIIQHLRELKDCESVTTVVRSAIERTGYDAILLGEFLGERKLANLHKLVEQARAADAAESDLSAFATQLAHFVAKLPKEALAATSPETADVIRLMTIHQAKGLEFPLVVVPDLNRRAVGPRESVALHAELGPVVRGRAAIPGEKPPLVGRDFYCALEVDEDRQEALRVLYVASTRAADHLILSAGFEAENQVPGELLAFVARSFDLDSGELLRELPEGYREPEIRVTRCAFDPESRPAGVTARSKLREVLEHVRRTGCQPVQAAKVAQTQRGNADRTGGKPVLPPEVMPVPCDLLPREFSFSRISGMLHVAEPEVVQEGDRAAHVPGDLALAPFAARDEALALGQLVHTVLEVLPFDGPADVPLLVARRAEGVLAAKDEPHRESIIERAEQFVARVAASARYRRLAGARHVAREVDFYLRWPPEHPHPPAPSPIQGEREKDSSSRFKSPCVIRGVLDCMYEDGNGDWHIVDYKTNRMTGRSVADVARTYELQLRVYAIAMEQIMGGLPRELVLWFLDTNEEYTVRWNDELREECVDAVNQAIAQVRHENKM
jgi:ATP-dependent helicase/nuclease subunit A